MRPPFLLKRDSMQFFLLQASLLNLVQGFDNISDHSQHYIVCLRRTGFGFLSGVTRSRFIAWFNRSKYREIHRYVP